MPDLACLHVTCGLLTSHEADLRHAQPVRHLPSTVRLHHKLKDVAARDCYIRCRCTAAMGKNGGGHYDACGAMAFWTRLWSQRYGCKERCVMLPRAGHAMLWFRKGLRLHDNGALHAALEASPQTLTPVFCLDPWQVYRAIVRAVTLSPTL